MNSLNEIGDEDFIPFLNGLGVNTYKKSFEWMLHDPDFADVLRWIYNSLDENNALTDREEYRYSEIEKKGKVVPQEVLEENIASLQQDFPDICLVGDKTSLEDVKCDIKFQNERLAMLEKHENTLKDLIKQNELTNEELIVEITKLNGALQQSVDDQSAAAEECIALADEVEAVTSSITNEVAHTLCMYEGCKNDKEIAKKFFAFGPFEVYRQSQAMFKSHFDLFSSRAMSKTQCEHTSYDYLRTALNKAKNMEGRLADAIDAYIETRTEMCGEQAQLEFMTNYTSIHPSQVSVAMLEAQSMLDILSQEELLLEDELTSAIKMFVDRQTKLVVDIATRTALSVREELMRDLQFLAVRTQKALSIERVVYGALRHELGKVQQLLHFAVQLRNHLQQEAEDVRNRMKSMTNVCSEQNAAEQSVLSADIVIKTLTQVLGGGDGVLPKLYGDLKTQIDELLDNIHEGLRNKEHGLVEIKQVTNTLMASIYNGCTKQANCYDRVVASLEHTLKHDMERTDARVVETSGQFTTIKNGDHQNFRKLWQWFLSDPARLFAAVKQKS